MPETIISAILDALTSDSALQSASDHLSADAYQEAREDQEVGYTDSAFAFILARDMLSAEEHAALLGGVSESDYYDLWDGLAARLEECGYIREYDENASDHYYW